MNFRANEAETSSLNIPQAAKVLKVTDKTIRNYIDRRFLRAEKWNGSWRIEKGTLLKLYWKKYGNTMELSSFERNYVQVALSANTIGSNGSPVSLKPQSALWKG